MTLGINEIGSRLKRIQVILAGAEFNILFAGICFVVQVLVIPYSFTIYSIFFQAALLNILFAVASIFGTTVLDGGALMEELLGISFKDALKILTNKTECLRSGVNKVVVCMSAVIYLITNLTPVLFLVVTIMFMMF